VFSSATAALYHPIQQTALRSSASIIAEQPALSELLYACSVCVGLNSLCLQAGGQQQQQQQTLQQEHEDLQTSAAAAPSSSSSEEVALLLTGVTGGLQRDFQWMVSCKSISTVHCAL
jgi:hypothetical protein